MLYQKLSIVKLVRSNKLGDSMPKLKHRGMGFLAGIIWLIVGGFLLKTGVSLVMSAALESRFAVASHPLFDWLSPASENAERAALVIFSIAVVLGYLKGRFILMRVGKRIMLRISQLPEPVSVLLLYGRREYIVIGSMIALGVILRLTGVPTEIRGFVLTAVGIGLIQGAVGIFRAIREVTYGRANLS